MSATSRRESVAIARQNKVRRSWPIHPAGEQIAGFRTGTNPHDASWSLTATGKRVDVRVYCGNGAPTGRFPQAAMISDEPWEEIVLSFRAAAGGKPRSAAIERRPGGELVLTSRAQPSKALSQLPRGHVAATVQLPSTVDAEVLQRLDPRNAEQRMLVLAGQITGCAFRMTPPFCGQPPFVF
jgi:hypothetical protein